MPLGFVFIEFSGSVSSFRQSHSQFPLEYISNSKLLNILQHTYSMSHWFDLPMCFSNFYRILSCAKKFDTQCFVSCGSGCKPLNFQNRKNSVRLLVQFFPHFPPHVESRLWIYQYPPLQWVQAMVNSFVQSILAIFRKANYNKHKQKEKEWKQLPSSSEAISIRPHVKIALFNILKSTQYSKDTFGRVVLFTLHFNKLDKQTGKERIIPKKPTSL